MQAIDIPIDLRIYQQPIKQIKSSKIIWSLGVYINPCLQYKDQFNIIQNKIIESIKKLMAIIINLF